MCVVLNQWNKKYCWQDNAMQEKILKNIEQTQHWTPVQRQTMENEQTEKEQLSSLLHGQQ